MLLNSPLPQCSSSSTSCRFSGVIAFDEFKAGRGIETGGRNVLINVCRTIGDFHDNHPTTKITKTAGIALRNQDLFLFILFAFQEQERRYCLNYIVFYFLTRQHYDQSDNRLLPVSLNQDTGATV